MSIAVPNAVDDPWTGRGNMRTALLSENDSHVRKTPRGKIASESCKKRLPVKAASTTVDDRPFIVWFEKLVLLVHVTAGVRSITTNDVSDVFAPSIRKKRVL